MGRFLLFLAAIVGVSHASVAEASVASATAQERAELTNAQLFALADDARDRGDFALAEASYRALAANETGELRREALFRLALMLADGQQRYEEAAVLLRQILDEAPDSARVRVELARMQAMMGNLRAAERELRAAQAIGLPPEVEQVVRFYAQALNARRPFGASLQLAIAPDSNINRATRSDTLETIIGDFTLDEDAQETSGVGLSLQGQAFARLGIDRHATLLARLSASGDFYRADRFDDYIVALQVGPQYTLGGGTLDVAATASYRWFGQDPYSHTVGVSADYRKPVSATMQIRGTGSITGTDNKRNDLQDGTRYSLRVGSDLALDGRTGGGLNLSGSRFAARDAGYATASGGVDGYFYREFGPTTAVLDLGYSHLEADERLFLYPRRRIDDSISVGLSGTFRSLRVGRFAPLIRLKYEKNWSTIEIYDYARVAAEIGVTAAF